MDTTKVISDLLDNQNLDITSIGDVFQMAQDFQCQMLMQELQDELNS